MKGTYVLFIELDSDQTITVGSLGGMEFRRGFYAYVGSAQGGIESRVARHKTEKKKTRWHIDYLLKSGTVLATIAIPFGDKTVECEVANCVARVSRPDVGLDGFGASDCACRAHLFYLGEPEEGPAAFEGVYHALSNLSCIHPYVSR